MRNQRVPMVKPLIAPFLIPLRFASSKCFSYLWKETITSYMLIKVCRQMFSLQTVALLVLGHYRRKLSLSNWTLLLPQLQLCRRPSTPMLWNWMLTERGSMIVCGVVSRHQQHTLEKRIAEVNRSGDKERMTSVSFHPLTKPKERLISLCRIELRTFTDD